MKELSHRSPLKDSVGYMLAHACKHHRQRAEELLSEIGLHTGQEMLLCGLWENEGITQTELANYVMIQPATVTNMLQRLEREGFVERRPDVEDQRVSRVYTTEKGRDVEERVLEKWGQLEQESFSGLTVGREGVAPSATPSGLPELERTRVGRIIFWWMYLAN